MYVLSVVLTGAKWECNLNILNQFLFRIWLTVCDDVDGDYLEFIIRMFSTHTGRCNWLKLKIESKAYFNGQINAKRTSNHFLFYFKRNARKMNA